MRFAVVTEHALAGACTRIGSAKHAAAFAVIRMGLKPEAGGVADGIETGRNRGVDLGGWGRRAQLSGTRVGTLAASTRPSPAAGSGVSGGCRYGASVPGALPPAGMIGGWLVGG